jgi:hypothetical protein
MESQSGECSELSQKIEQNKNSIKSLNARLSSAEDDIDELQDFDGRTFISSLQDTDYGRDKVPGFLVLKDQETNDVYALEIRKGVLATRQIVF